MSATAIILNLLALLLLGFAFFKDINKAKQSIKVALMSFINMLPSVLIIIVFIGLLMAFVPPETIAELDAKSGIGGVILIALVGAIMFIPALISFPLAGSLLESGFSVSSVAAFILSLTMVGTLTLPVEIKVLGKKFAFLRNGFSLVIAIIIALIMGVIL